MARAHADGWVGDDGGRPWRPLVTVALAAAGAALGAWVGEEGLRTAAGHPLWDRVLEAGALLGVVGGAMLGLLGGVLLSQVGRGGWACPRCGTRNPRGTGRCGACDLSPA
ncbi:MAG TPA: hypothetical protein VNO17_06210 [Actinomycetota bacterium]|nr:hypothetical protein [Actinomycetota bacterium]